MAYEWNLNSRVSGPREQTLTASLAAGYRVSRWFTPFLELNTVTKIRGAAAEAAPPLRDRVQLYLTPGFNIRPFPGLTFRTGLQLPVSTARQFDYTVHGALVWEF